MRPADYSPLVDAVSRRFSSWTVRNLSFSARLQLISSVIYSLVNFWMGAFLLPKGCLRDITKLCSRFLWSGDIAKPSSAKVSWRQSCLPKAEGGLGLRDLFTWNKVLNLKLIWMVFSKADSLWVSWVRKHWLRKHVFWTAPLSPSSSWTWRSLLSLRPLARRFLACKLGNGEHASFWHDRWQEQGEALIDVLGGDGPQRLGIPSSVTVAKADVCNIWHTSPDRARCPRMAAIRTVLQSLPPIRSDAGPDRFFWGEGQTRSPHFSTRETWALLRAHGDNQSWASSVWFKSATPKHSFLLWVTTLNRLPLRSRLAHWGISDSTICCICQGHEEDRDHLFLHCDFAKEIWSWLSSKLRCDCTFASWDNYLLWLRSASSKEQRLLRLFAGHSIIYAIWKERNSRLHTSSPRPALSLIQEIDKTVRTSLLATRTRRHHGRLLSLWFRHS